MDAIAATDLKSNFKFYADKVSGGDVVLVKRPKNEPNLILITESRFSHMEEMLAYYKKIAESITDSPIEKAKKRLDYFKGQYTIPDNIDETNSEISDLFNGGEI